MPNARSIANLKPWPKGKSGNPRGRPKDTGPTLKDWQDFAKEYPTGESHDKDGKPLPTRDDTVMKALYLIAINIKHRDVLGAIKEWFNRTRGKSPDKLEVGGRGDFDGEENPITTVLEVMLKKAQEQEAGEAKAETATKAKPKPKRAR